MKVAQAADRFVTERVRLGEIRGRTPTAYRRTLRTFANDLGDPQVETITTAGIRKWAENRDVQPNTIRSNLIVLRSFFRWAKASRLTKTNPAVGVAFPKVPQGIPRSMRADEVTRLVRACPDDRIQLVAFLMAHEALRIAEVCRLTTYDLDVGQRLLHVTGKGERQRIVPISDETWTAMHGYGIGAGGPLIRSKKDRRKGITPGWLGRLMSDVFYAAGLKSAAWDGRSGHALRHTAAITALRDGASPVEVRDLLGHGSLVVTDIYVRAAGTHLNELRKVMSSRSYA